MPSAAKSLSRFTQSLTLPWHGALLGLVLAGALWMLGVPNAVGFSRPVALPLVVVAGAVLVRWFHRTMTIAALVLCVIVAVGVFTPIVPRLAKPFVRNDAVNLDSVDAVFVFSASMNSRGMIANEALDRLLTGLTLRARRPTLPLVVSTIRSSVNGIEVNSAADQRALINLSPATGPVVVVDSVYSTRDEAVRLTRHAFLARWKRVVAITSPMHSRRACGTVEALGLAVTCVAAPWRPASWPARTASDRLLLMQRLTYETMAWAQYRVTGWAAW
jgi:uncharacterized SAM-binding protein YcdF (DUF218 family)